MSYPKLSFNRQVATLRLAMDLIWVRGQQFRVAESSPFIDLRLVCQSWLLKTFKLERQLEDTVK